jgi:ubiquinone/menaquinone biosynthesis C-methylase UbiE
MGKEINLLADYPKSKRNLVDRENFKSEHNVEIARKFGKDFFDGGRETGYGGFNYNSKYWTNVVKKFKSYWKLNMDSTLLDVGCAKGFMLYDLSLLIPGINFKGIDISKYAIDHALDSVKKELLVANARDLPFENDSFDFTISINTVHNLELDQCAEAIKEISRVSKKNSFITVDAYRNDEEKERMYKWNLTAKTIMSVEEWIIFFKKIDYKGDYYWFIP